MKRFVLVTINHKQIERAYSYSVPSELEDQVQTGSLVTVPFGKQVVQGVVLGFIDPPDLHRILDILEVRTGTILSSGQLWLAQWLAKACFAPLGACISLMIPAGLSQRADVLVEATSAGVALQEKKELSNTQKRLLNLLQKRGALRGGQISHALPQLSWRPALRELEARDLVRSTAFLPPPGIGPKTVRSAQLSLSLAALKSLDAKSLGRTPAVQERRRKVLDLLAKERYPLDFSWIYAQTGASYADLKVLAEAGFLHFNESEVWRDSLEKILPEPTQAPELTSEQKNAWEQISSLWKSSPAKPVLLHGVTGSGKTEIYMRAVTEALKEGQQVLVLVPEIAMTPQTVRRYMARFPNQVGLYHSQLSEGERYDTWRRVYSQDLQLIVGPRSALFLPYQSLKLIVIDECDHDSFDEQEREPFYHTVETAIAYCQKLEARLIMGSATPRATQYYQAQRGHWFLVELPNRVYLRNPQDPGTVQQLELPPVRVVDMRAELRAGNRSVLSGALQTALTKVLERREQAILFLNRKGSSTYVFCRDCGKALLCPQDSKPLVYHASRAKLLCHSCGYERKMPQKCPNCESTQIRQLGLGTEKLEALVCARFPEARVMRWDAETGSGKDGHELILSHFAAHRADFLIGTQVLSKGLDLPLVTLVGIVLADLGLNLPDFRAAERSFQVLTQVSGRAGRSLRGGSVILQTYNPENFVIQAAAKHDFSSFYTKELALRRAMHYPPYSRLVRLEYRHTNNQRAQAEAHTLAELIRLEMEARKMSQSDVIGPFPCFIPRLYGRYRWQLVMRGPAPASILDSLPLQNWVVEIDPPNLL
jgi:primosomal protein N' (replication factor Y)